MALLGLKKKKITKKKEKHGEAHLYRGKPTQPLEFCARDKEKGHNSRCAGETRLAHNRKSILFSAGREGGRGPSESTQTRVRARYVD